MKGTRKSKKGKRVCAWLLALVMVASLVTVPAKTVEAAETSIDLLNGVELPLEQTAVLSDDDAFCEKKFEDLSAVGDFDAYSSLVFEAEVTLQSCSSGTTDVVAYAMDSTYKGWADSDTWGTHATVGQKVKVTVDLKKLTSLSQVGVRMAKCTEGATIKYTINSAKIIGIKLDVDTSDYSLSYTHTNPGDSNGSWGYTEYNFTLKNNSSVAKTGDLVITFADNRTKNWWTTDYSVSLNNGESGNVMTVSNLTLPANGSVGPIQVQLNPTDVNITSVTFAGKNIAASGTSISSGGGAGSTDDYTGSLTYEVPADCVDDATETPFSKHGKLHVDMDTLKLTDANGNPYQLRGISTHGINWSDVGYPYVNFQSFKNARDILNADAIRMAMYTTEYYGYCDKGSAEKSLDYVQKDLKYRMDKGVQCATALGMYAIVDWHILKDLTPQKYKDNAKEFFEYASKRYAENDNVLYEICNEPNGGTSWADIKSYAEEIIPIIRANDPDAIIIVGTPTWSQDVDVAKDNPIKDNGKLMENVMYTIHFYANSHTENWRNKFKAAAGTIPIFATEFGMCDSSGDGTNNFTEATAWLDLLDDNCVSYFCWSLCQKNETASLFSDGSSDNWTASNLRESGNWIKAQYTARKTVNNSSGVSVTSITLNQTTLSLVEGEEKTLIATVTPETNVTWKSSDTSVATVKNGLVTAVKAGEATITASAGGKSADCRVTVTAKPSAKLSADTTTISPMESVYGATPEPASITINNTGNASASNITATLKNKTSFNVEVTSATAAAGGSTSIKVTPKSGQSVGNYTDTITVSYNNGVTDNNTFTIDVSYTVTQRPITIKADNKSKTYGEDNPEFTYSVTSGSLVSGDTLNVTPATTAGKTSDADSYDITLTLGSNPNYNITAEKGTLKINKKPVSNEDITFPVAGDITVGQALSQSVLTGGSTEYGSFAWENPADVPAKGSQSKNVVLTLNEKAKKNYSFEGAEYNTSAGTITKAVTVLVNKAGAPTIVFPTASAITFGESLEKSDLTGGSTEYGKFDWVDSDIVPESAGNKSYDVVFTPNEDAVETYELESVTKPVTIRVDKAANPDTPVAPTGVTRTKNTIQMTAIEGYEYSKDGGANWQADNKFTSLSPFTEYQMCQRIKKTDNYEASAKSTVVSVYTLVSDPYTVDVSKLNDSNYVDAVRDEEGNATISYGGSQLILSKSVSEHFAGYVIVGNASNVTVKTSVDSKITLNGATINKIDVTDASGVEIIVTGTNQVTNGIISTTSTNLTLYGNGTLNTSTIKTGGDIKISNGVVNADASGSSNSAIKANGTVEISGGTVTAKGGANAPAVLADKVVISSGNVTVNGGNGASAILGESEVKLTGGTITPISGGNDIPAIGTSTNEDSKIIKGDNVILNGAADGMYSKDPVDENGNLVKQCSITYVIEGSQNIVETKTVGQEINLPVLPSKKGCTAAWQDNKGVTYLSGASVVVEEDMTFTAVYTPIKVTGVNVSVEDTTLDIGDTIRASVTVTPSNALNTEVTWKSGNATVATVDNDGLITAKAAGITQITATAKDGSGKSGSVIITVEEEQEEEESDIEDEEPEIKATAMKLSAKVKGVSDIPVKSTYMLAPKKTMQLNVTFLPENAEEEELTFTSSKPKVATVNSDGKITAKKAGTTTITVKSENGLKKTFKVKVVKKAISKIKLKGSKTMKVKKKQKLKVTLSPNKKYVSTNLVWKSSNPKVATVSSSGQVKALKKGKVKITAIATDGSGKKATITINVK